MNCSIALQFAIRIFNLANDFQFTDLLYDVFYFLSAFILFFNNIA